MTSLATTVAVNDPISLVDTINYYQGYGYQVVRVWYEVRYRWWSYYYLYYVRFEKKVVPPPPPPPLPKLLINIGPVSTRPLPQKPVPPTITFKIGPVSPRR